MATAATRAEAVIHNSCNHSGCCSVVAVVVSAANPRIMTVIVLVICLLFA